MLRVPLVKDTVPEMVTVKALAVVFFITAEEPPSLYVVTGVLKN
jgi:hypothetical protein